MRQRTWPESSPSPPREERTGGEEVPSLAGEFRLPAEIPPPFEKDLGKVEPAATFPEVCSFPLPSIATVMVPAAVMVPSTMGNVTAPIGIESVRIVSVRIISVVRQCQPNRWSTNDR